jgi:hypothetical protein
MARLQKRTALVNKRRSLDEQRSIYGRTPIPDLTGLWCAVRVWVFVSVR